jgi:RTX calcium-binding nonapeptide repeat (4 copies)
VLYGSDGDDELIGNEGRDTLYGGAGNDELEDHYSAVTGSDVMFGGDSNDTIHSVDGADQLFGDDGANHPSLPSGPRRTLPRMEISPGASGTVRHGGARPGIHSKFRTKPHAAGLK